jgi:hypothetical protein
MISSAGMLSTSLPVPLLPEGAMTYAKWSRIAFVVAGFALVQAAVAAEPAADAKAAPAQGEFKLPPGWTAEDLQACMLAGTPGKMHQLLGQAVGEWTGKNQMWMGADSQPIETTCTSTVTSLMDGRFFQVDMKGEMPGMGPYRGLGLYGFDNVSGKFASTWIDNHGTGLMQGTGTLSDDGKTITWNYTFNCPITKKPAVMREVETVTGPNTKTLEMYGADPKSGKEYKMMRIELTKK